jgi:hypothetical protein
MLDQLEGVYVQIGRISAKREFQDEKEGRKVQMVKFESLGLSKNFVMDSEEDYAHAPPEGTTVRLEAGLEMKGKDGLFTLVRPRFLKIEPNKKPSAPATA